MSIERTIVIGSTHGLHARPAKLFAQAVKESGAKVTVAKGDGKPVNAASILGIIALGINHQDTVTITVDDDENGEAIADSLSALLLSDIDAE